MDAEQKGHCRTDVLIVSRQFGHGNTWTVEERLRVPAMGRFTLLISFERVPRGRWESAGRGERFARSANTHLSDDETVAKMGHPNPDVGHPPPHQFLLWVRPGSPAPSARPDGGNKNDQGLIALSIVNFAFDLIDLFFCSR